MLVAVEVAVVSMHQIAKDKVKQLCCAKISKVNAFAYCFFFFFFFAASLSHTFALMSMKCTFNVNFLKTTYSNKLSGYVKFTMTLSFCAKLHLTSTPASSAPDACTLFTFMHFMHFMHVPLSLFPVSTRLPADCFA